MQPKLHIIGTGGTIAGVSRTGAVANADGVIAYDAATLAVDALLQGLQQRDLSERFAITSEQLVNIDSKDMNPDVWWQLAQRLNALSQDTAVQGVVITHGTDTLEETAYFIELLRQSGAFKRSVNAQALNIVFTAAMRPADAADADGPQNLTDALHVAANSHTQEQGVVCVLHSRIHSALNISKAHSTAIDAFTSLPYEAVGEVKQRHVIFKPQHSNQVHQAQPLVLTQLLARLHKNESTSWPWMALVLCHAGVDARMVSTLVEARVQGIVLACTGNGTISKALLPALREAQSKGIKILRASRVWQGGVEAFAGDEFESTGELSAVKARVHFMLQHAENTLQAQYS